jgi:leucyl aminopeptidase
MKKKKTDNRYSKIKIKFLQDINAIKDKSTALVSLVPKKESEVIRLPTGQKSLSVGIGKKKEVNNRKLVIITRKIIDLAKQNKIKKLAIDFHEFSFPGLKMSKQEIAEILTTNFEMANFEFIEYKTPPEEGWDFVEEITIAGKLDDSIKKGGRTGQIQGEAINNCRILANTPGGSMTPKILAEKAKEAAKGTAVNVKILGSKQIEKHKMGGVLGVAKGSIEVPQFIIMEYFAAGKEKPIVLVGKGVTFDSGGLNLKPFDSIKGMHTDMSGGAAVISTLLLAAKLKLKKNIVGLIPAVENMPSGSSYRPGDILKTMSGKTVEVLNTDAEGRIILADALTYAKRYDPKLVVDIATLTGAAMIALGQRASAIFTKDLKLEQHLRELGEKSGDYVWPLPLWEEYEDDIKGTYGDFANTGKTRYGGAITAAIFLYQFIRDYPWIHIDIAPRMTAIEGEYLAKGASGAPVRLLIKLIETM